MIIFKVFFLSYLFKLKYLTYNYDYHKEVFYNKKNNNLFYLTSMFHFNFNDFNFNFNDFMEKEV